jgi:putative endonuclease
MASVARTERQLAGDDAETLVVRRLTAAGWSILGRNVRLGRAEIDVLGVDPAGRGVLVAVEVRWRRRRDFGLAEETVDWRKRRRLWAAVAAIAEAGELPDGTRVPRLPLRLDVVAVEPDAASRHGVRVRHHRGIGFG